jgi:hypothetical protein
MDGAWKFQFANSPTYTRLQAQSFVPFGFAPMLLESPNKYLAKNCNSGKHSPKNYSKCTTDGKSLLSNKYVKKHVTKQLKQ